jgi:hypothetical protein
MVVGRHQRSSLAALALGPATGCIGFQGQGSAPPRCVLKLIDDAATDPWLDLDLGRPIGDPPEQLSALRLDEPRVGAAIARVTEPPQRLSAQASPRVVGDGQLGADDVRLGVAAREITPRQGDQQEGRDGIARGARCECGARLEAVAEGADPADRVATQRGHSGVEVVDERVVEHELVE